jgi:hypothetical protein
MKENENDIIMIKENIDEESNLNENIPLKIKNTIFRTHKYGSLNSSNQDKR